MPRDWKTLKCAEQWRNSIKEGFGSENTESDSDSIESDPEEAAERDYALQNGLPLVNANNDDNPAVEAEKKKPSAAKISQAKAERKARCRGVSGSMTKKQKSITKDDWDALYDEDYDFIDPDESCDDALNSLDDQDQESKNHFNGLNLQDFTVKVNEAGLRRKKIASETSADVELNHQTSLNEKNDRILVGGGIQIKAVSGCCD